MPRHSVTKFRTPLLQIAWRFEPNIPLPVERCFNATLQMFINLLTASAASPEHHDRLVQTLTRHCRAEMEITVLNQHFEDGNAPR